MRIFLNHFPTPWKGKILSCGFAGGQFRPRHDPACAGITLANYDCFQEQLEELKPNDLLYLGGGDATLLIAALTPFMLALRKHAKNVAAFSAGISALASKSWNADHNIIVEGLGIMPYSTMVHVDPLRITDVFHYDTLYSNTFCPILFIADNTRITLEVESWPS